jgi:tetratricopeptide (TPR) repeat protein
MRSSDTRQAIAHLKAGRAGEALHLLREATPEQQRHPRLGLALATARLRTRDPAGALDAFNRVLANSPAERSALYGRALALHALGDRIGALTAFRTLAGDPDAWKAWQSKPGCAPGGRNHSLYCGAHNAARPPTAPAREPLVSGLCGTLEALDTGP